MQISNETSKKPYKIFRVFLFRSTDNPLYIFMPLSKHIIGVAKIITRVQKDQDHAKVLVTYQNRKIPEIPIELKIFGRTVTMSQV